MTDGRVILHRHQCNSPPPSWLQIQRRCSKADHRHIARTLFGPDDISSQCAAPSSVFSSDKAIWSTMGGNQVQFLCGELIRNFIKISPTVFLSAASFSLPMSGCPLKQVGLTGSSNFIRATGISAGTPVTRASTFQGWHQKPPTYPYTGCCLNWGSRQGHRLWISCDQAAFW
jgi:hypothetical protein